MKRGKRQVIDREASSIGGQGQSLQTQGNLLNESQFFLSKPQPHQESQNLNQSYITAQQPQTSLGQSKSISNGADEKRKKLQLLKQKYLKKSKPQDTKPPSDIPYTPPSTSIPPLNNNHLKTQPLILQPQPIPQSPNPQRETINLTNESSKQSNPIPNHLNRQQTQTTLNQHFSHNQKSTIPQKNQNNQTQSNPQLTTNQPQKPQISRPQQAPKPPVKIPGRNAPPPPPIKKTTPLPVLPVQQHSQFIKSSKNPSDDELNKKTVPFPLKQQLITQKPQFGDKTERSDNLSFAPPSLEGNQINKMDRKESQNVPPPPINPNMRQILNKKLSHQKNVPKPPVRPFPPKMSEFDDNQNQNSSTFPSSNSTNEPNRKNLQLKPAKNHIDDQYNGIEPAQSNHQVTKTESYEKVDTSRFIGEWLGSPEMTLKELFPHLKETIEFYCLNKNLTIKIASSNPGFTSLIAQFIQSFILNNTTKYTLDQKRVTQSICLNFFYSSATEFSDIFLVLLIKTGEELLQKYQKALQDRLQSYLSKIVFYKNLFLPQQISSFVVFCVERNLVKQSNFLQFLMLTDNSQLLNLVNNVEIQQLEHKLGLLSFCKLNIKNKNMIALYLKLISSIEVELGRNGLVERVLNHLKELDIPQNMYQYTKQLKLKLLKNYQNNSQPETINSNRVDNNQQPTNSDTSKDSGLFGYFNLNKAIDKIKTSTEKALSGAIQKPKKAPEQQKKDQIVYDPIRKRYIINGEIPQDENEVETTTTNEVKTKVPPPPPLGGRKAPPPMHNKKPGPRIAVNRYV